MDSAEATQSITAASWNTLKMATTNATSLLAPSPKDLLLVVPRMAAKAGSFVTEGIPEAFENMFGGGITGRAIAEATGERAGNIAAAVSATGGAAITARGVPMETGTPNTSAILQAFTFRQIRTFSGIFSYMTSKWALGCFAAAVILNRTSIYAAARRHLRLNWQLRVVLRILPILVLFGQASSQLRAMRCQTSPDFSFRRYGKHNQSIALDFAGEDGFFHRLSSLLLFWESEEASCLSIQMIPTKDNPTQAFGSLSLLWPAFLAFCFSHLIETLSCAVEGRAAATETGMTLFEHSLAFAEAEAMVGTQISLPLAKVSSQIGKLLESKREAGDPILLPLKGIILSRFNTPPEVLLMALISCLDNLSSHILGVLGIQSKYRLLNTAIWGLCFMSSFMWGFFTMNLDSGLFRFPTVCVVGFIPHILILAGICFCGCVYSIALVLSVLSPPEGTPGSLTIRERFQLAHQNMQANAQLSGLRLRWHEDFYTALLRIGFSALMAASEAVFLNEGKHINVGQWTWLEEDRMNDVLRSRHVGMEGKVAFEQSSSGDQDGNFLKQPRWRSGYSQERTTKTFKGKSIGSGPRNQEGIGAFQRSARYVLAFNFLTKIFWLTIGWTILTVDKLLSSFGLTWRPAWMRKMLPIPKGGIQSGRASETSTLKELEFWILSDDGELSLPHDGNVDVEQETKKRLRAVNPSWGQEQEAQLDSRLYSWFTHGGWWGERDSSGDYRPSTPEDDTTSVVSASTATSDSEWESDLPGRRTPTLADPYPSTAHANHDTTLDAARLAQLLNPCTLEERDEARMLAAHLANSKPLTRSQYSRLSNSESARLLTSTKYRPANFRPSDPSGKLTPVEEAEVLEYLIVRFRNNQSKSSASADAQSWHEGAEGLGPGGPMCVVLESVRGVSG
ncbi:MAG: hypothetical protein LQ340_007133, partial [Diploschistes diacapsis]